MSTHERRTSARSAIAMQKPTVLPDPGPELTIVNRDAGQVIEITLPGPLDARSWPALQHRLLSVIRVRQPAALWLDLHDVGALARFPAGLQIVAAALAEIGATLITADRPEPAPAP